MKEAVKSILNPVVWGLAIVVTFVGSGLLIYAGLRSFKGDLVLHALVAFQFIQFMITAFAFRELYKYQNRQRDLLSLNH